MRSRLLSCLLVWFFAAALNGQSFNDKIYQAYITGDMNGWEKTLKENNPDELKPADLYDFAMAHYGFIGYCLGRDQKQRARPYLDKVELMADKLADLYPEQAEYIALRGALYGFQMSYQPHKSMFIGPKAQKKVNLALEKDPECPQALIEKGNMNYWMPGIFGGSKTKALADYEKAIRLMENNPSLIRNNWYYLNIQMILASWSEESGRTFAAREIYRKLIQLEPRFSWAREKLEKK